MQQAGSTLAPGRRIKNEYQVKPPGINLMVVLHASAHADNL